MIGKLLKLLRYSGHEKNRYKILNIGFHGDLHLIYIVQYLASRDIRLFIETGANVGSTLNYFASNFPRIKCLSCEPDVRAFETARNSISELSNASVLNMTSQEMIQDLLENAGPSFYQKALFWLDAHGYGYEWPLIQMPGYGGLEFFNDRDSTESK